MRFYLLDRIDDLIPGKSANGIKCWSMTNEIFSEHFPGYPIVPGVLLLESKAQLLGYLIEESHNDVYSTQNGVYVILSNIHKAKFRELVQPGDKCILIAELKSLDLRRAVGRVETFVDDKCVAEASISFVIVPRDDLPANKYADRRAEYLDIITRKLSKK